MAEIGGVRLVKGATNFGLPQLLRLWASSLARR